MPIAVAANTVPLIMYVFNQLRVSLRHPTDDEEGGFGLVIGQQGEDFFRVANYPLFHEVPIAGIDNILEGGDLEVVFHVNSEVVADWVHEMSIRQNSLLHLELTACLGVIYW